MRTLTSRDFEPDYRKLLQRDFVASFPDTDLTDTERQEIGLDLQRFHLGRTAHGRLVCYCGETNLQIGKGNGRIAVRCPSCLWEMESENGMRSNNLSLKRR